MKEKEHLIHRRITKEEEGQYLRVPFQLDCGGARMTVSYDYDRARNTIDFGLSNEAFGFIGWSGSDRREIFVSERGSAAGYAQLPVKAGTWEVLLGAYHVAPDGCEVTIRIHIEEKRLRLLKGDTHMHTVASDGKLTPEQLCAMAEAEGLDYLVITDHNNYAQNDWLRSTEKVTMIPGAEWTNYKGHAGMLGVKRPFIRFEANTESEMRAVIAEAKKRGALVSLNHPFCPYCGWKWGIDAVDYDLIEIWNGALIPSANEACLAWWDAKLKQGQRISVIGGSDFHRLEPGRLIGVPCTGVYAPSSSAEDILEAMRCGHSVVSLFSDGPFLNLLDEQPLPGEEVSAGQAFQARLTGLKKGDEIRLVSTQECICEMAEEKEQTLSLHAPQAGYLRIEVRRASDETGALRPVMIANPYYVQNAVQQ